VIEVTVSENGEELSVTEIEEEDSADPSTRRFIVYAWRKEN
jgi:hypothetical protein